MPTNKPQKSVNLDLEDHELAQRVAVGIQERLTREFAGTPAADAFKDQKVPIKSAIHYGLVRAAQELELPGYEVNIAEPDKR